MPSLEQVLDGRVVGFVQREFDAFTAGDGRKVAGGVARSLWLSTDFGDSPAHVTVPSEQVHRCDGLVFGNHVKARCRVSARRDQLTFRLVDLEVVPSTMRDASA